MDKLIYQAGMKVGDGVQFYTNHKTAVMATVGVVAGVIGGALLVQQFAPDAKTKVKETIEKGKDAVVSKIAHGPVVSPTQLWNPVGSIWEEEEATYAAMAKLESKQ